MSELLLHKARRGDPDAFTALCAPFEGLVYRHCLQMLKNPADAQDAAQEAMLKAWRAMPDFRAGSGVATWLFRIAHNVCLDWFRNPRNRAGVSLETLREAGYEPADTAPDPETRYLNQSERDRLDAAIARLPDELQTLLLLRYGDGLSYDQLSEALHINPGTVKSRLNRVKDRLHSLLERA